MALQKRSRTAKRVDLNQGKQHGGKDAQGIGLLLNCTKLKEE